GCSAVAVFFAGRLIDRHVARKALSRSVLDGRRTAAPSLADCSAFGAGGANFTTPNLSPSVLTCSRLRPNMPTQVVPGHDRATPGSLQSFGENRLRWNGGSLSRHGRPPRPRRCHQNLASLAGDRLRSPAPFRTRGSRGCRPEPS